MESAIAERKTARAWGIAAVIAAVLVELFVIGVKTGGASRHFCTPGDAADTDLIRLARAAFRFPFAENINEFVPARGIKFFSATCFDAKDFPLS